MSSESAITAAETPAANGHGEAHSTATFKALMLGSIGVVYGDIGTSPLYTMKEVFSPATGIPLDATHLIGAVSVIFWGLMAVVTLKYVLLILRADNRGEGGIMALTALAANAGQHSPRRKLVLLLVGVFGAALFYGDSVITPAISVLSAVEGLEVATPAFKPYILPICAAVLVGLFAVQRFGNVVDALRKGGGCEDGMGGVEVVGHAALLSVLDLSATGTVCQPAGTMGDSAKRLPLEMRCRCSAQACWAMSQRAASSGTRVMTWVMVNLV